MKTHDYNKYAKSYAELGITNSYYLAFKDVPLLLEKYTNKNMRFLDYGCGKGRSLRFIKSLGYNDIVGVDISQDMIEEANKIDPKGNYNLMENSHIPYEDNTFDTIFMSYVFLDVGEYDQIVEILKEFKRVLKDKGHVIFITSIVKNIKDKWLSFSYDFPENHKDLTHCQNLKLLIKDNNIILHDYNWTNDDYERAIKDSGLRIKEIHIPMGNNNDPYKWLSEKTVPYHYIYILEKLI